MDKFINLMYDFFAFAFPGACIIVSILLLRIDDKFLYHQFPDVLVSYTWHTFLVFTLLGYIMGYVIRPVARYLLLINLSVFLFSYLQMHCNNLYNKFCLSRNKGEAWKKFESTKKKHKKLVENLKHTNLSNSFIKIRELTPRSSQYIEFWDMHITMAHNLAFACLVFLAVQLTNYFYYCYFFISDTFMIILFITIGLFFFILLRISLKFANWWSNDLDAALWFISQNKKSGHDKSIIHKPFITFKS